MQTQHFAQFAVFGQPVAHSKSPRIHRLFAAQQGQDIDYRALALSDSESDFRAGVDAFFAAGGLGANITVPFKEWACRYADELIPPPPSCFPAPPAPANPCSPAASTS